MFKNLRRIGSFASVAAFSVVLAVALFKLASSKADKRKGSNGDGPSGNPSYNPTGVRRVVLNVQGFAKAMVGLAKSNIQGGLKVGSQAPDFTLQTKDGSSEVTLSKLANNNQPVVLIFGSYT